jgi:hypothetical protein
MDAQTVVGLYKATLCSCDQLTTVVETGQFLSTELNFRQQNFTATDSAAHAVL